MTAKLFKKLILAVLVVLLVALALVDVLASRVARRTYEATLTRELAEKGRVVASVHGNGVSHPEPQDLRQVAQAAGGRITVIAWDGRVLADSEASIDRMENHAHRPEVQAALEGRVGSNIRHSQTVGIKFLYVAIPIREGALRLAMPMEQVDEQVETIRRQMLASTALAFIPAVLIAAVFARIVSGRLGSIIDYAGKLAQGDFSARLAGGGSDELGILSAKLNDTGEKLRKMVDELEHEHAELEKLERVRKDFVINVSHELRTPLASIQGYTETLLDGALHDPEHNVRFLGIIRQNAERLGRLTADLMTLSQIELKRQRFQFASYLINDLVAESVDSMLPMAQKKSITITQEAAPRNTEVFCDAEAVQQVMSNLIENAVKYTPEGGCIYVSAQPLPQQPGRLEMVEVSVRDTGIGIPEDDLPRLFERFYRVDKARSRQMGGTGLGLAIVKHLVRAQGGDVRVTSKHGEGSTFSLTLPVQDLGLTESVEVQPELTTS